MREHVPARFRPLVPSFFAVVAMAAVASAGADAPAPESTMTPEQLVARWGNDIVRAGRPMPLDDGALWAFRVHARDARMAFLAASFNNWASNVGGRIDDPRHAMRPVGDGVWLKIVEAPLGTIRYKYVLRDNNDDYLWIADPAVDGRDPDNNTVLDLRGLLTGRYLSTLPGRPLSTETILLPALVDGPRWSTLRLARVSVPPEGTHELHLALGAHADDRAATVTLRATRDLDAWTTRTLSLRPGETASLPYTADGIERPIVVEALVGEPAAPSDRRVVVMPVARHIADDLRYGFHATWNRVADDYPAKAEMLANLLVNGVEFYDYFPAHGKYAPTEEVYEFEPFYGGKIHARDIKGKIDAGHDRGMLAIAYVAAYAASASVYRAHPFPMTNSAGEPLVFNGAVMSERETDARGLEKWFWMMAIARDSPWHAHILEEWRRTLDEAPADFAAFDGLEIDSYGHPPDERYYSPGSIHNGRLLAEVIAELIGDAQRLAHETKPGSAVSFNCVNEFGIERMYPITDFLFVENWATHKAGIEETVDICYHHRAAERQRVVLKMYPPDAGFKDPPSFPPANLRLMMGMCIAGGGSLMIAGEPDERTGQVHALNSLYYPDHIPMPAANVSIVRDYNRFDAMLHGLNHGPMVRNHPLRLFVPGCVVRGFVNEGGDVTAMLLQAGEQTTWNQPRVEPAALTNVEVAIDVPDATTVAEVLFVSPDDAAFHLPVAVDFERVAGAVRCVVPSLRTTGALIVRAAPNP